MGVTHLNEFEQHLRQCGWRITPQESGKEYSTRWQIEKQGQALTLEFWGDDVCSVLEVRGCELPLHAMTPWRNKLRAFEGMPALLDVLDRLIHLPGYDPERRVAADRVKQRIDWCPCWEDGNYKDWRFVCRDCGRVCVWSADEQKHWNENARVQTYDYPARCPECAEKERKRRADISCAECLACLERHLRQQGWQVRPLPGDGSTSAFWRLEKHGSTDLALTLGFECCYDSTGYPDHHLGAIEESDLCVVMEYKFSWLFLNPKFDEWIERMVAHFVDSLEGIAKQVRIPGYDPARRALVDYARLNTGNSLCSWFLREKGRSWYIDEPFFCRDCGREVVWTALEQKQFYEEKHVIVYKRRVRCPECAKKEHERRENARRVSEEGQQRKAERIRADR